MASSRSAAPAATLSIASDPRRPVLRADEAAVCSASAVSSRASSSLLAADRPSSSTDSLASLPSSDAASVTAFSEVKMFLLEGFACARSNGESRSTFAPIALDRANGQIGQTRAHWCISRILAKNRDYRVIDFFLHGCIWAARRRVPRWWRSCRDWRRTHSFARSGWRESFRASARIELGTGSRVQAGDRESCESRQARPSGGSVRFLLER